MKSGPQGTGWLTRDAPWSQQLQHRGQQVRADLYLTAARVHVSTLATQDQSRDQQASDSSSTTWNVLSDYIQALVLVF